MASISSIIFGKGRSKMKRGELDGWYQALACENVYERVMVCVCLCICLFVTHTYTHASEVPMTVVFTVSCRRRM